LVEQSLHGQEWKIERAGVLAVCGGGARVFAGSKSLPFGRRIAVQKGCVLHFKADQRGCYAYLAMEGGVHAVPQLGSASTYLPAGLGGHDGRALQAGDVLESDASISLLDLVHNPSAQEDQQAAFENWGIDLSSLLFSDEPIRFMRGPEFDWFDDREQDQFRNEAFRVSAQSNRMGYQLEGPLFKRTGARELLSTAVTRGTIQVTHQGSPVVLMADAQTIGGYPRIGQVAAVDLPRLAQMRPGQQIQFREIPWEAAEKLYFEREKWMRQLREAIRLRIER
jgi:antagonist of KipI